MAREKKNNITSSSTAEYFSKNLQQVGFSSPTKAVLTTLKEAVDNALDACEESGILPELEVQISKLGPGTLKNTDLIQISVLDNGPGLEEDEIVRVFGEYLASSKFGRGRCSRGQQGIGISAATTWAQLTSAKGVAVITKTEKMRLAISCRVQVDIKNNRGVVQDRETIKWDRPSGVSVQFVFDGRLQIQGEGGLLTYLMGTSLVNPHLTLHYKIGEEPRETLERVSNVCPEVPDSTEPHPHTMKLGEFIAHSHLFGRINAGAWLKKGFSRVTENTLQEICKNGADKKILDLSLDKATDEQFKNLFTALQATPLMAPSTKSVMTIGEEAFSKSIRRLGEVDFFSVVTRKPTICDFKPVAVEVAIARLKSAPKQEGEENAVQVLRFANRVPLQFDKAGCAMVKAIESVSWRTYGLAQPKGSLPVGDYVIAVSLVSPFIKFRNASKETVDASDELVEELRRALIQAGQRLSRHIRKEAKAQDLEDKRRHIEQFCPILVDCLVRITSSPESRKRKATEGILKLLARDVKVAEQQFATAEQDFQEAKAKGKVHHVEQVPEVDPNGGGMPAELEHENVQASGSVAKAAVSKPKSEKTSKSEKHSKSEKKAAAKRTAQKGEKKPKSSTRVSSKGSGRTAKGSGKTAGRSSTRERTL